MTNAQEVSRPTTQEEVEELGLMDLDDFRQSGLLYLLNRFVLHPLGFAMSLYYDGDGQPEGWTLEGDGIETWEFSPGAHTDGSQRAAAFLQDMRERAAEKASS